MSVGVVIVAAAMFDQWRQGSFQNTGLAWLLKGLFAGNKDKTR